LATTAGALTGPGLGFQPPGFATTASWADKPVRPVRRCKVLSAGGIIAEGLLELDQGAGKSIIGATKQKLCLMICSARAHSRGYNILCIWAQRDKFYGGTPQIL
jgi:hypothetical protein